MQSALRKLKNLYAKIVPHFDEYGFKPPSAEWSHGICPRRLKPPAL